jgi:hypothetical protein
MKTLSLCQRLGALCLALAVCVAAVGCDGYTNDQLLEEVRMIEAEKEAAGRDPAKLKIVRAKEAEWQKKFNSLSDFRRAEITARRVNLSGKLRFGY